MSRRATVLTVVVLGGMVGTGLRFGVAVFADGRGWSTSSALLIVNSLGAFALGWFIEWRSRRVLSETGVAFASAGILASFTTFSGVMVEAAQLVRSSEIPGAIWLLVLSIGLGWLSAVVGRRMAPR